MTSYTITLDDERAKRLEERAKAEGASAQELLAKAAHDLANGTPPGAGEEDEARLAATAAVLQERIDRMDAGGGVDARDALRGIANKHGLTVPR